MYAELEGVDFVTFFQKNADSRWANKWAICDFGDKKAKTDKGDPWYEGAYGNCLIALKYQKITDCLYLVSKDKIKDKVKGKTRDEVFNEAFLRKYALRCVTRDGIEELQQLREPKASRMRKATIDKYMQYVTKVGKLCNCKSYYIGDNFLVDVIVSKYDKNDRRCFVRKLVKEKKIPEFLETLIWIRTYYKDKDGNCLQRYNITQRKIKGKVGMEYDYAYFWEYTPENERELVAQCIRLYVRDNKIGK